MDAVKKVVGDLQKQCWVLFMPKNVLDAHRAGVLEWWGVPHPEMWNRARLSEVGITAFGYWGNEGQSAPPLPRPTITDAGEWSSVIRHFKIGTGGRYKILQYDDRVFEIIIVRAGCYTQCKEGLGQRMCLLRDEFKISVYSPDFLPDAYGTFIIVQKIYLPDQIRKLRRRLTDRLCKRENVSDVIRVAKFLKLK